MTPNRITYGGSRALGRRYWELEMHAGVLRVYCLSAEYFVFTLELIQAHKTSAISTQQMHWRYIKRWFPSQWESTHKLEIEAGIFRISLGEALPWCEILGWGNKPSSRGALKEQILGLDQPDMDLCLCPLIRTSYRIPRAGAKKEMRGTVLKM